VIRNIAHVKEFFRLVHVAIKADKSPSKVKNFFLFINNAEKEILKKLFQKIRARKLQTNSEIWSEEKEVSTSLAFSFGRFKLINFCSGFLIFKKRKNGMFLFS